MRRVVAALVPLAVLAAAPSATGAETPPQPEAARPAPLLFYPESPRAFDWRIGAGLMVDVLPMRIVESEQRQIPEITGAFRVGLPARFSADLRARAIVIQNQLELGLAWSLRVGPVSFALHNHIGPWFGVVGVEGFDTKAWGIVETPGVSVGVPWQNVRFSLMGEAVVTFAQHTTLGDATKTSRQGSSLSGTATTLTVETLLEGGGVPYFGVGILWMQPDAQAWLAFSDERARVIYPRFTGGYAF